MMSDTAVRSVAHGEAAVAPPMDDAALRAKARWAWRETLILYRRAPEIRLASSLSPVEIFVALYYGGCLRYDPGMPFAEGRDRLIVSKGHGSLSLYPILADLGYFPQEVLETVGQPGSFLGGIPDPVVPGYETINGSLGHGLGVAVGMALGLKRKGSDRRVFAVVGDAELHEGSNWEAIMFASQHGLDNLCLIVDDNGVAMLGPTEQIVSHGVLDARLGAFGWDARTVDGHDVVAVRDCLQSMKGSDGGRPLALVARTKKGRGVPGLEGAPLAHVLNPSADVIDTLIGQEA